MSLLHHWLHLLLYLSWWTTCAASLINVQHPSTQLGSKRVLNSTVAQNATSTAILQAEQLLSLVIAQQSAYNTYRVANPRRNMYISRPMGSSMRKRDPVTAPQPPILNATILAAAALIAERDAALNLTAQNPTEDFASSKRAAERHDKRSSSYWLPQLSGSGLAPMGSNASYQVYRDVTDPKFGAKGDGTTDDTAAINAAIAYDNNCGSDCLSSSVKGTLIYFPPGTYLISSPINALYYSQLVGDATNIPTIKTSASFVGLGAIQSDVYIPGGDSTEWYIEQSNFYRQVRNFRIDISGTTTASTAGLHWQVAQATSLINVAIIASSQSGDGNTQMGMFTENGSGGFMSDVFISGGAYGIYGGNQQYTVRDFTITGQTKACILLLWDWGWTWSNLVLQSAPIGISLLNPQGTSATVPGSIYILDSSFSNLNVGIYANFNESIRNSSIITLDNIKTSSVSTVLQFSNGQPENVPSGDIAFFVAGGIIDRGDLDNAYYYSALPRPAQLLGSRNTYFQPTYYYRGRPQYETMSVSSILSVKSFGAYGDGTHDDTAAIRSALAQATTSNLIYFPAGSYLVSSTIVIPKGTRMTGEVWSQLVATGSYFGQISAPKPMVQVGQPGDVGSVEISDILFTSTGPLPGLVLVEWNIQADSQGSAALWDSHFRLGGAYGTRMQVAQCPYRGALQSACVAASLMLHVTPSGNGYFENMWAWTADHDIDDSNNTMISVAAARGILIESDGPTWLYGTASEHSMLYQYNFASSTNTFATMIQTESPYFQGVASGISPGPFKSSMGLFTSDPQFPSHTCSGSTLLCEFAWALLMQNTTNLTISGAGLYSWYGNYGEACVDSQNCQQRIAYEDGENSALQLWNLITIGAVEMLSVPSANLVVPAFNYTQSVGHPYWSALAGYLDSDDEIIYMCMDNDTRPACNETVPCDLTQSWSTFADLSAASSSILDMCIDFYAVDTLYTVLNDSLTNYTIASAGYDAVFGDYQSYMKQIIPQVIADFMAPSNGAQIEGGPGNAFFECTCSGYGPTTTQQCPFRYTQLQGAESYTMTYKLTNSSGFYSTLQSQYGVNASWVTLGDQTISQTIGCQHGRPCIKTNFHNIGIPLPSDNITIPNPKDVVTQALPNIQTLQEQLLSHQADMSWGFWNGSADDLLQTYSMPILMIQQAILSMQSAKQLGQQYAKEKKIQIILEVLGGVFALLPFIDEITPELEILSTILTAVSEAGNVALTIQSIVADPQSAPMDVLGLLLGGGGKDEAGVASIAAQRRDLSETDIADIGQGFKESNDEFEDVIRLKCDY